jgi:hypothetical protein
MTSAAATRFSQTIKVFDIDFKTPSNVRRKPISETLNWAKVGLKIE